MLTEQEREVEYQKKQKKGALAGMLMNLSRALPASMVEALGGPMIAGMLVGLGGGIAVGLPAAYMGLRAINWNPSAAAKKANQSAFGRIFGETKSMAENVMDPDAIRAANQSGERPHPDDGTSLGYMIPGDAPGGKDGKAGGVVGKGDGAVDTYGDKKVDGDELAQARGRFATQQSPFAGSGGGGMIMGGSGGSGVGKQAILGGSAGSIGSASGSTARTARAGIKSIGRVTTRRTGARDGLRAAVSMGNKGYGMDQVASGGAGAAFGEAPKAAAVIGGGPAGIVGGSMAPGAGGVQSPSPHSTLGGSVTPAAIPPAKKGFELNWTPFNKAAAVMLALIGAAFILGKALKNKSQKARFIAAGIMTPVLWAGLGKLISVATDGKMGNQLMDMLTNPIHVLRDPKFRSEIPQDKGMALLALGGLTLLAIGYLWKGGMSKTKLPDMEPGAGASGVTPAGASQIPTPPTPGSSAPAGASSGVGSQG